MTDGRRPSYERSDAVVIHGRRAPIFWILLPPRFRKWWMMRDRRKAERQFWTSHFPLLTPESCKRVAKVLRAEWDHTGVRLLGVPKADYLDFAKRLITSIHARLGTGTAKFRAAEVDPVIAAGLAELEAELGLRDSPLEHRLAVATHIRGCLNILAGD
jgi:hypothetical protein